MLSLRKLKGYRRLLKGGGTISPEAILEMISTIEEHRSHIKELQRLYEQACADLAREINERDDLQRAFDVYREGMPDLIYGIRG